MIAKKINLNNISEEDLLNLKICDLPLKLGNTWLKECVEKLYNELELKGFKFRPRCYLADEWLTPDTEPVIGIPFFLAHPVLMRLEKKMMLEVEGETKEMCMKLLRHEAGHAVNYAYQLHKRRRWRDVFGPFSKEYPDTYKFRPYSRNFVRHLEDYYAQYHPDEDFAETFAVWLSPDIDWRAQYSGWRVIHKLRYIDEQMDEIKDKEPCIKKGEKYWEVSRLRITLKNYYKKKRSFHAEDFPDFHDTNLRRIFSGGAEEDEELPPAYVIIKKYKKDILNNISVWTGERKYIIDDLLRTLIGRAKDLSLGIPDPEPVAVLKISIYMTTLITNYRYTGRLMGKK